MSTGRIIGKKEEIRRVSEYVKSDKAEFLVVYGRRKTI